MSFGESQGFTIQMAAGRVRMAGANTTATGFELVNSAADFSNVKYGWKVVNTTASPITSTYALKPMQNVTTGLWNRILLLDDIFGTTPLNYQVIRPTMRLLRPPFGLEPEVSFVRWVPPKTLAHPEIYGVELWAWNGITPASLIEPSSATLGLLWKGMDFHPLPHLGMLIRCYTDRAVGVTISATNKSIPTGQMAGV